MSDLVYQNYNNKCKGWINPSNLLFGPQIVSLTGYQSPAGSNTVVSINGVNFFSYSVIRFGTFTPSIYFINSTLLSFYVPNTLTSGTFPVQVCNGSVCSNIVNYTIDIASGYWMINSYGNIINSNGTASVSVTSLTRGAPNTIVGPVNSQNAYTVQPTDNWIICDTSFGDIYLTLPLSSSTNGRELMIKRLGINTIFETHNTPSLIMPLTSNSVNPGNIIMTSVDTNFNWNWVTLVYNFSNNTWITMQAG